MIDSHCHLDLYPEPAHIANGCVARNLTVISVTTAPSAWHGTRALGSDESRIITALGFHPQLAADRKAELELFDQHLPSTRFVGEIGLDGTAECRRFWSDQLAVFKHILRSCQGAGGRIMSIHSRRAAKAVLEELRLHPDSGTPILHWFSGTMQELDQFVALGCWFSVGLPMLVGDRGRALIRCMPRDRVLPESDGPFVKSGDRAMMPWDVQKVVDGLGKHWGVGLKAANEIIEENHARLVRQV